MASIAKPVLNVLKVTRLPIYNQLFLEEALLRGTADNWFIINDGAFFPAIVMGISGKPHELIHVPKAAEAGVQVIKRFTGGGTVVVDHDTVFGTLIFQGAALPKVECYPQPIMKWTEGFYADAFGQYGQFSLRENDYVFSQHKFGGNAQAITGKRWLHHTSFLWDYEQENMALLKQPAKQPKYREDRRHGDFIMRLKDVVPQRHQLVDGMMQAAHRLEGFEVRERTLADASAALRANKMYGTKLVDLRALLQQQMQAAEQAQAQ